MLIKKVLYKFHQWAYNRQIKHGTIDVRQLFWNEYDDINGFNRYDMIVRLLAIENYYQLNDYGYDLYKKMQAKRQPGADIDRYLATFIRLIQSYNNSGYDNSSEIQLDKYNKLYDGSHRMALAFFHKQYVISCQVLPIVANVFYGLRWFKDNDFNTQEIAVMEQRYVSLKNEICNG